MGEPTTAADVEAVSAAVRDRLTQRFGGDRAAALYGYWQLLTTPTGTARLRSSLGPDAYRSALAALAHAGVDIPRQSGPGPAAGTEAQSGPGAAARQTVDRQVLRQAALAGLFGWGTQVAGRLDLSFVRAGATGYHGDTMVVGVRLTGLLPGTFHVAEVRARPSLLTVNPPVLLRVGGYSDGAGLLTISSGWPSSPETPEVIALFAGQAGPIEAVVYRCYDGPAADDTSFAVARGVVE